jgi:hypothetical protein
MNRPTAPRTPEVIAKHVEQALARHRETASFVRLLAAELPPREQPPWLRMADALATGDLQQATVAASAAIACWIPLFASAAGDSRLPARLLQTAASPPRAAEQGWLVVVYPLALVAFCLALLTVLSTTLFPIIRSSLEDWGQELPLITQIAFGVGRFMASVWRQALVMAGLGTVSMWLAARWSASSSATAARFTRCLARLVAAEIPADESIAIASRAVAARGLTAAAPRRPLSYAAVAALDFAPRTAAVLLDAVAECHEDQARNSLSMSQWFIGPVMIGFVGLLVGFIAVAFLMPLVKLATYFS